MYKFIAIWFLRFNDLNDTVNAIGKSVACHHALDYDPWLNSIIKIESTLSYLLGYSFQTTFFKLLVLKKSLDTYRHALDIGVLLRIISRGELRSLINIHILSIYLNVDRLAIFTIISSLRGYVERQRSNLDL